MIYDVDETDWNVYLSAVATIYSFNLAADEEKNQC